MLRFNASKELIKFHDIHFKNFWCYASSIAFAKGKPNPYKLIWQLKTYCHNCNNTPIAALESIGRLFCLFGRTSSSSRKINPLAPSPYTPLLTSCGSPQTARRAWKSTIHQSRSWSRTNSGEGTYTTSKRQRTRGEGHTNRSAVLGPSVRVRHPGEKWVVRWLCVADYWIKARIWNLTRVAIDGPALQTIKQELSGHQQCTLRRGGSFRWAIEEITAHYTYTITHTHTYI